VSEEREQSVDICDGECEYRDSLIRRAMSAERILKEVEKALTTALDEPDLICEIFKVARMRWGASGESVSPDASRWSPDLSERPQSMTPERPE